MAQSSVELSRKYSSFSGCDIKIIISGIVVAAAQAMSYAVQREKAPTYVLGRPSPLAFSRGKRGIAGSIVSLMLDRHFLAQEPFTSQLGVFDNDEFIASPTDSNNAAVGPDGGLADIETVANTVFNSSDISSNFIVRAAWYVDQLPPSDVAVVAANEYGNAASMRVYGLEFLNEGSGFSVDDMQIENQMTYVAREVYSWRPLGTWDLQTGAFSPPNTL
jgi:hypothetical protein